MRSVRSMRGGLMQRRAKRLLLPKCGPLPVTDCLTVAQAQAAAPGRRAVS
jgi:hypothetical protein